MPELDLMEHGPSVAAGFGVGLFAFVPLLLALLPVLRRQREANMAVGLAGVIVSFAILFMGVIIAYVFARGVFLAFSVGELIGFVACPIAVGVVAIALGNRL